MRPLLEYPGGVDPAIRAAPTRAIDRPVPGLPTAEHGPGRSRVSPHGGLAKALLDTGQRDSCFRQAIATAQRQQSKGWELRATMSLARLWQRQGRRDEARAALAAVFDTYTEGFTTPDLVDAAALLKALA